MGHFTNYRTERYNGVGAIAETFDPDVNIVLSQVRLHLDIAGGVAEDFTITMDSATDPSHDANLLTQDMEEVLDLNYIPDNPVVLQRGDELDFAYANTNGRTWGLEVMYRTET